MSRRIWVIEKKVGRRWVFDAVREYRADAYRYSRWAETELGFTTRVVEYVPKKEKK